MHRQRGLVRAVCTARNAYNPALALALAFNASNNEAALKLSRWNPSSQPVDGRSNILQGRAFSGSQCMSESAHTRTQEEDSGSGKDGRIQKQKRRSGGTFAGYEALMGDVATRDLENVEPSQPKQNSIRYDNDVGRKRGMQGDMDRPAQGRSQRPQDGPVIHLRPKGFLRQHRSDTHERQTRGHGRNSSSNLQSDRARTDSKDTAYEVVVETTRGWKAHMQAIGEQANKLTQHKPQLSEQESEAMRQKLDYTGMAIDAEESTAITQMPFPWVSSFGYDGTRSSLDVLSQEIKLFAEYAQPSDTEKIARQAVKDDVSRRFANHFKRGTMRLELFGSELTNLSTATSDLDFRVLNWDEVEDRPMAPLHERVLRRIKFLDFKMRDDPNFIATVLRVARYPIINTQHRHTGIDVQIVSSPSSKPQQMITEHYLNTIPNLRQIYFVIKHMLGMRGLVDVFYGGTGSYGLFIMLVASLTRRGIQAPTEPGAQLLHFLDFYCTHDFTNNGISLSREGTKLFRKHDGQSIPRKAFIDAAFARKDRVRAGQWSLGQRRPFQPYLPCIQDPASALNDLGRKMNAVKHIVATFDEVRQQLRVRMDLLDNGGLKAGQSLLLPAVGRCHEVHYERRRRVGDFGAETLKASEENLKAREENLEWKKLDLGAADSQGETKKEDRSTLTAIETV